MLGLLEGARPSVGDAFATSTLSTDERVRTTLNFYDYAGQDPINAYDLNGQSCKWMKHISWFGDWLSDKCHGAAEPFDAAASEFSAQVSAAGASVATGAMGEPSRV